MSFNLDESKAYNEKASKYLAGGVHYNFRKAWDSKRVHFVNGKGIRIWDMDGNEYLDFFCKFGANILGHANEEYINALKDALSHILATDLSYFEYELCKKICECVKSVERVRFSLSGTSAVQNAIRLSRAYTGKNKFIRFISHYHGNADNIMGGKIDSTVDCVPVEFKADNRGTYGRAKNIMAEQSFLLPWNDVGILERIISEYKDEIAAIITEPICVNTKSMTPSPMYLETLRKLCTENNIVLIFDEVITGFRISLGGAQALFDITPDLTVFGKAIAGGAVPLSAIGGRTDIMDMYAKNLVTHGGTFNGYPLGLAAANATLDILSRNNGVVYDHMEKYYSKLIDIFKQTAAGYGFNMEFYGHPTCSSYSCIKWSGNEKITPELLDTLISKEFSDNGILFSNVSTIYSSISINDSDIQSFQSRLPKIFESITQKLDKIKI